MTEYNVYYDEKCTKDTVNADVAHDIYLPATMKASNKTIANLDMLDKCVRYKRNELDEIFRKIVLYLRNLHVLMLKRQESQVDWMLTHTFPTDYI